ncbi:hypothetical protein A6395_05520 [Exiguobacterium sp. SH31]|uniref:hypothetical protein n=1 Tax=Exiguobacterium sp. SH31 TaxID=1843183 RepID=UPI0008B4C795|nr:hypothetical protein [Exiguobacterium sp. SH31]OGX79691.1 hypothetical protein A6395_05520 [Exiguobacterium sp. SH31]
MKRIMYPLLLLTLLGLYGCEEASAPTQETEPAHDVSWWLVDWASEASVTDTVAATSGLNRLMLFTSYVDASGHLFQTDEGKELIETVFATASIADKPIFLTVVNDRFVDDKIIQKDPSVITDLLDNPDLEAQYWQQLFNLLERHPFTGVEMDFEKIPPTRFEDYIAFLERTKERLREKGMTLRVIFEPGTPFEDVTLPSGIEYVVMAYNLHGFHTPDDPGPKATYSFFDQLSERMTSGTDWTVALAAGGFLFKDGRVTSLTELDALDMLPEGTKIERDPASSVLRATYVEDGVPASLWWADGETMTRWMAYWEKHHDFHNFSLWRAGEWSDSSLKTISTW